MTHVRPEGQLEIYLAAELILAQQCKPFFTAIISHDNPRERALDTRTVCFSLGEHFSEVNHSFTNQVGLLRVVRKTRDMQIIPSFDPLYLLPVGCLWGWWRRRRTVFGNGLRCIVVLVQGEPDLLIPLGVLAASLDRTRPLNLPIHRDSTVGILFSYVSFVWKVLLGVETSLVLPSARDPEGLRHTAFSMTTTRVPTTRGVADMLSQRFRKRVDVGDGNGQEERRCLVFRSTRRVGLNLTAERVKVDSLRPPVTWTTTLTARCVEDQRSQPTCLSSCAEIKTNEIAVIEMEVERYATDTARGQVELATAVACCFWPRREFPDGSRLRIDILSIFLYLRSAQRHNIYTKLWCRSRSRDAPNLSDI